LGDGVGGVNLLDHKVVSQTIASRRRGLMTVRGTSVIPAAGSAFTSAESEAFFSTTTIGILVPSGCD
jgi:hypothetical protein